MYFRAIRQALMVLALAAMLPLGVLAQPPQDAKARKAQLLNAELMIGIRDGNRKQVDSALGRGADPNGRNWLGITPLIWAAVRGDRTITERLVAHHADLNAGSVYGAPISFAIMSRHEDLALYLIDKAASIHSERADGATPLMFAAANGETRVLARLLARKADPNAKDKDGATALIYATRNGHADTARQLIEAGAEIDAQDSHGRTALMYSAANGRAGCADLLLANRASVNLRDADGGTALTLAARYSGSETVVRRLLQAGADYTQKDSAGAMALSVAEKRGYIEAAQALREKTGTNGNPVTVAVNATDIRRAVDRSIMALQKGMKTFAGRAQCVSCHHQGLGMMALGTAQQHGFALDKQLMGAYMKQIGEDGARSGPLVHAALHDKNVAKTVPALDIGDLSIGAGYIFGGLIANGVPSNPGLQEMAQFLVQQQAPDGHWSYGFSREPMQSSFVTTTALMLQILHAYGAEERPGPVAASVAQAKRWLLTTATPNTEDKASRLLGLHWAGATKEERAASVQELLAAQRPDGGWAQLPNSSSDAYATGMALYSLRMGGEDSTNSPAYQKGVQFLLRTQDEDGTWYINKRANPANTYFDAGFPHGESQYASFAATCWATMALAQIQQGLESAKR